MKYIIIKISIISYHTVVLFYYISIFYFFLEFKILKLVYAAIFLQISLCDSNFGSIPGFYLILTKNITVYFGFSNITNNAGSTDFQYIFGTYNVNLLSNILCK